MTSTIVYQRTFFADTNGQPLDSGKVYIGTANADPEVSPISCFWDAALTIPATQPLNVTSGYITNSGIRAAVYVAPATYSLRVRNKSGIQIDYVAEVREQVLRQDLAATTGATQIGFKQADAGSQADTVAEKLALTLHVADFFPAGFNPASSDCSSYIAAAITALIARGGGTLRFDGYSTYRCDAVLGSFNGSNITIDLCGAVLDFSNVGLAEGGPLLEFAGTYDAVGVLTADASAGQKSVSVVSSGFAIGDMVRIYSTSIWDSTRTNTRLGEISFIETIPGGASLTVTTELKSSYTTAASGAIQKITPVRNVVIRNGKIQGPSGNDELIGLHIKAGINCRFEGIHSVDVDKVHARFTDCLFSKATSCHFEQSNHSAQAYGLSFTDACQDCSAIGNSFVDVRHSMTTNNNVSTSYGITRRILFQGNVISDSAKATGGTGGDALDTHAGAEDIAMIGNTINSASNYGINFEARTGVISNNMIIDTASGGININPRADTASSITCSGNTLRNIGDAAAEYGILFIAQTAAAVNVVISDNRVIAYAQPIRVVGTGYTITRATISGNVAQVSSAATTLNGIEVTAASYVSVCGNAVSAGAQGIVLTDCSYSAVNGNAVEIFNTSGSSGYGVRLSGTGAYNAISGNTLRYSASGITTTYGVSLQSTITYTGVWSNTTSGFVTGNVSLSTGTGNVSANNI